MPRGFSFLEHTVRLQQTCAQVLLHARARAALRLVLVIPGHGCASQRHGAKSLARNRLDPAAGQRRPQRKGPETGNNNFRQALTDYGSREAVRGGSGLTSGVAPRRRLRCEKGSGLCSCGAWLPGGGWRSSRELLEVAARLQVRPEERSACVRVGLRCCFFRSLATRRPSALE